MFTKGICIAILLFIMTTVPLCLLAQTTKGFTISGHLDGLKDGDMVKLGNRFMDWHNPVWTDSSVIVNGNFYLRVDEVPEGPRDYEIIFLKGIDGNNLRKTIDFPNHNAHGLTFFAENGEQIIVSGNTQQWKDIIISGSRSNDARNWATALVKYASRYNININISLRKIADSIGYDKNLVEEQINLRIKIDKYLDSVTKNEPAFHVGIPYLLTTLHDIFAGYHGYFQNDLYLRLTPAMQNSFLGKQARNFALLSIGQPFPDFSLLNLENKKINLKNYASKNKITLVHFWGTNSVDRKMYQDELVARYNRYRTKGMGVIGVSADTAKDEWEIMVRAKKYPWINVIADPRGWGEGSLVNDVYGEGGHSIPNTTNVLIDSKGIIIAWDVSGPELQYYLEKYLLLGEEGQAKNTVRK